MVKAPKKRGPGRPPSENPRLDMLHVRVTSQELDTIKANAQASDQDVSQFVREKALAS